MGRVLLAQIHNFPPKVSRFLTACRDSTTAELLLHSTPRPRPRPRLELAHANPQTNSSMAAKMFSTRTRSCASLTCMNGPARHGHSTCRPGRTPRATCNSLHRSTSFSRMAVSTAASEGSRDPSPSSIPQGVDSGNRSHVTDFVVIGSGIGGGYLACF